MAGDHYDLFVIGAGSGGVRAGRIAAGYGARVAVAEEYRVGGTCVIRGCVPKKLMVYAARFADEFADAVGYGWTPGEASFDWPTLIANKDREIERLSGLYVKGLEGAGATIIKSRAVLEDPHTIRLMANGRTITADTILIATGGHPFVDRHVVGVENAITSNEMFHLPTLPRSIVIEGGGFISVEFAGILNGLGVDTTIVYRGGEVLRGFDDDIRAMLHKAMEKRGVKIITQDVIEAIEKTEGGVIAVTKQGRRLAADHVLLAIGRVPNTAGLGLDKAGVVLDAKGAVEVDDYSRSNVENIYAIGDVTNRLNLTPVAIREGHAFADTVFGKTPVKVDHSHVAEAVFSTPEIGVVGLTEAVAVESYPSVDIYKATFRPMRNTLSGRDEQMLMKLVVDAESGRVLGAHILGPDASEMAQLLGVAVKMGATKADLDATMAVHPTAAEELVTMRQPSSRIRRAAAE